MEHSNLDDEDLTDRQVRSQWFASAVIAVTLLLLTRPYDASRPTIAIPEWGVYCADGNIAKLTVHSDDPRRHRLAVIRRVSKNPWELTIQKRLVVLRGEKYRVSFDARADATNSAPCVVREFHPPWDAVSDFQQIPLESDWKHFEFEFLARKGTDHAVLEIQLGNSSIQELELRQVDVQLLRDSPNSSSTSARDDSSP
ncbi:MAG: carbohydrate binding domain-containing protein [Planctomycetota bacterium]